MKGALKSPLMEQRQKFYRGDSFYAGIKVPRCSCVEDRLLWSIYGRYERIFQDSSVARLSTTMNRETSLCHYGNC